MNLPYQRLIVKRFHSFSRTFSQPPISIASMGNTHAKTLAPTEKGSEVRKPYQQEKSGLETLPQEENLYNSGRVRIRRFLL